MDKYKKMNTKKTLVSFLLIASVLVFAAAVNAAEITTVYEITANDVVVSDGNPLTTEEAVSVVAGDSLEVKVKFTSAVNGSDVKIKATLEGESADLTETTAKFDVEAGKTYIKTLTLEVPSDFEEDELNTNLALNLKVWNSDDKTEFEEVAIGVQKQSYDVAIKSVITSNVIEAGQTVSVDVMLENVGYNDIDDLFVTVKIPELNIEKKACLGDLIAVESEDDDDDEETTVNGRFSLDIPYTAKSGKYTLVVEAENEETTSSAKKEITVSNSVSDIAMKSGSDLVLINPTNQIRVYKLVYQSQEVSVIMPAASTKTVPIEVPANGDYSFDISVFSGDVLLSTVKFSGSQTAQLTSPVFVLTVILAIVFLVLLVALVVLITKKPQKTEEFGESYY